MKYFVYVLQSLKDKGLYIGMTNNIERRLYEHNLGYKNSTRARIPFRLIYTEEYPDRKLAREREKELKSGSGREFIKQHFLPG